MTYFAAGVIVWAICVLTVLVGLMVKWTYEDRGR